MENDINTELEIEKNEDIDFNLLSNENPNNSFAEGLAQKILSHILSANHLYQGYR
jgi:hypothetical protein